MRKSSTFRCLLIEKNIVEGSTLMNQSPHFFHMFGFHLESFCFRSSQTFTKSAKYFGAWHRQTRMARDSHKTGEQISIQSITRKARQLDQLKKIYWTNASYFDQKTSLLPYHKFNWHRLRRLLFAKGGFGFWRPFCGEVAKFFGIMWPDPKMQSVSRDPAWSISGFWFTATPLHGFRRQRNGGRRLSHLLCVQSQVKPKQVQYCSSSGLQTLRYFVENTHDRRQENGQKIERS